MPALKRYDPFFYNKSHLNVRIVLGCTQCQFLNKNIRLPGKELQRLRNVGNVASTPGTAPLSFYRIHSIRQALNSVFGNAYYLFTSKRRILSAEGKRYVF